MLTETIYKSQKVSQKWLSKQMKFILINIGDSTSRGEIFSCYYGPERQYYGYYTDPCMRGEKLRKYQNLYNEKQPVFSKALRQAAELAKTNAEKNQKKGA